MIKRNNYVCMECIKKDYPTIKGKQFMWVKAEQGIICPICLNKENVIKVMWVKK